MENSYLSVKRAIKYQNRLQQMIGSACYNYHTPEVITDQTPNTCLIRKCTTVVLDVFFNGIYCTIRGAVQLLPIYSVVYFIQPILTPSLPAKCEQKNWLFSIRAARKDLDNKKPI